MIPEQYLGKVVIYCHNHYIVDAVAEVNGETYMFMEDSDGGTIRRPFHIFERRARIWEAR